MTSSQTVETDLVSIDPQACEAPCTVLSKRASVRAKSECEAQAAHVFQDFKNIPSEQRLTAGNGYVYDATASKLIKEANNLAC